MSDKTTLGDKCKLFEGLETERYLIPQLPIMCRLDGKSFSSFCRGLAKPYDERLHQLMVDVITYLLEETGARVAYTQSDEMTLLYYSDTLESQVYFNGKIHKLTSVLASMASACFNTRLAKRIPEKEGTLALFDCRVWNVPNKESAVDAFEWRIRDCYKNAVSGAAQTQYSHKELMGVNTSQKIELLHQKGIDFTDYPLWFRRGTFARPRRKQIKLTEDLLHRIPEKNRPVDGLVERTITEIISLDTTLRSLKNPIEFLFDAQDAVQISDGISTSLYK